MDIVERVRIYEIDHEPEGWPAIKMKQVSAMADEIERLRAERDQLMAQQSPVAVPDVNGWATGLEWDKDDEKPAEANIDIGEWHGRIQCWGKDLNDAVDLRNLVFNSVTKSTVITEQELHEKNESIRKLLADLRAMRKAVPDKISYENIGANATENAQHQGYVNGWNDCVDARSLAAQPRITEQDALDIGSSAFNAFNFHADVDTWFEIEGRALLNKLNNKPKSAE